MFVDDNTRYVWVYPLKHKDEVFHKFLEWKSLVEKSSGCKLKYFVPIIVENLRPSCLRIT